MLKKIINKIIYPNTYCSDAYIRFLRKKGCSIGKGTFFFEPKKTMIDFTRPYLINIGEYCKITSGVIILSHDYSKSVLRMKYKEIIGEAGVTKIGNNVFIGMNSIILRGIKIGDNVIIGAGSVVTRDIPNDVVVAGNPARIIMTLEDYYKKRKEKTLKEAKEYAKEIYLKTNRKPSKKELDGFYPIFTKRDLSEIKRFNFTMKFSGDDYEDAIKYFLKSQPIYKDFDEFLMNIDWNTEDSK